MTCVSIYTRPQGHTSPPGEGGPVPASFRLPAIFLGFTARECGTSARIFQDPWTSGHWSPVTSRSKHYVKTKTKAQKHNNNTVLIVLRIL